MKKKARPFKMWMIFQYQRGRPVCIYPGLAFDTKAMAIGYLFSNRDEETYFPAQVLVKQV